ncbi:DUF7213 family protein [Mycobacterium kansasii]
MRDPIRVAIQELLDSYGDGWAISDYVVVMGLERVGADGELETMPWWHTPPRQAQWVTDGLIVALDDMRNADVEQD